MAANLLRAFDLASPDTREQFIIGFSERLSDDELRCFQDARRRLEHRFDMLCGISSISGLQLPHEIQLQIVGLLGITDIYYCLNVCRQWRYLLLQCTEDLPTKYFPGHFDKTRDEPERLHRAIRKRHFRDSGRFRTRFTCAFLKNADGTFAMDRVEGLQQGRTFRDLACARSLHLQPPSSARARSHSPSGVSTIPHRSPGTAVSRYLFSDGVMAWQLMPAPGEWAHPIIVHDFHAHKRWDLSLPSMRTKGIKLVLWALGNGLVVARVVGERILYAWDLISRAVDRVTLQTLPSKCFTSNHSVVIVSQSGELLLWSFRHGLEDVDTSIPQDEDKASRSPRRKNILKRPLTTFDLKYLTVMFHPRDKNVFFLATYDDRDLNPNEIWVCEFRNKRCCQIFTYSLPARSTLSALFHAQMIDAHGTYRLLEHGTRTDEGVQLRGVTFNTISKSFGGFRFQAPLNTDCETCLIWNDQLVLRYDSWLPHTRPWPLLVVGPSPSSGSLEAAGDAAPGDQSYEVAMECMMKSATSLETVDSNLHPSQRLRTMIEALGKRKQRHDIIRAPRVPDSMPDLCTAVGLRYMLLYYGGQCNWEGDHDRDCPGEFGLPMPLDNSWATAGDDDFLVIVNEEYYTVFAVDEDGEIAEAVRDSTTLRAQEVPYESDQRTGSEQLSL